MPPALLVGSAIGTLAGATISFAVPASTKPGDTYVMIVGTELVIGGFPAALNPDVPWIDSVVFAATTAHVGRRVAKQGDPPTIAFTANGAPAWALSVLLVYRDLRDMVAVGWSGTAIAASTNFACPSRTLVEYSDLYLGIALVDSAATAVTPPAGTTERHEQQAGGRTLEVFELLAELAGATGVKTATTVANQSGGAASIALAANGLRGAGKVLTIDPPGMLGLPTEGV